MHGRSVGKILGWSMLTVSPFQSSFSRSSSFHLWNLGLSLGRSVVNFTHELVVHQPELPRCLDVIYFLPSIIEVMNIGICSFLTKFCACTIKFCKKLCSSNSNEFASQWNSIVYIPHNPIVVPTANRTMIARLLLETHTEISRWYSWYESYLSNDWTQW